MSFKNKDAKRVLMTSVAVLLAFGLSTSAAFAADDSFDSSNDIVTIQEAISTDETWFCIEWTAVGVDAIGCPFDSPLAEAAAPWEFDCGIGSCWLTVTDLFISNDQLEVFDEGSSIGSTSVPGTSLCGGDPDVCRADKDFSSGKFCLGPGSHSITIKPLIDPVEDVSDGAIKVELHEETCSPVGGEFLPIDTTPLLVAGAQTNAFWILSTLAVIGSIAFGALYLTTRRD